MNTPSTLPSLQALYQNALLNWRFRPAIIAFRRALRWNPRLGDYERFWLDFGLLYDHIALSTSKPKRMLYEQMAIRAYRKAQSINPRSFWAEMGIARVYWHRKDKKALAMYLSLYRNYPARRLQVMASLGAVYKTLGNFRKAQRWYETAIHQVKRGPARLPLLWNILPVYDALGEYEKELRVAQELTSQWRVLRTRSKAAISMRHQLMMNIVKLKKSLHSTKLL